MNILNIVPTTAAFVLLGIAVSAPMGPTGALVVQRVFKKGKLSAFLTGVGASISDLIYSATVIVGVSTVLSFMNNDSWKEVFSFASSFVLALFGLYQIFRNTKLENTVNQATGKISIVKEIFSGFLFTFSNPLIILFITTVLSLPWMEEMTGPLDNRPFYYYVLAMVGVLAGALLWWFVLTISINWIKNRCKNGTKNVVRGINVTLGIIFIGCACVTFAQAMHWLP